MSKRIVLLVGLYLTAIVAANLIVTEFGPRWSILNAFLFIGLDLTSRDGLHEAWWPKVPTTNPMAKWTFGIRMGGLIATGSMLSFALNRGAGKIALASFVAFAAAAVADTVVFQALHKRQRFDRITGSNFVSSAVDSLLFPLIAFGWPLMWDISLGQFTAKVCGGVLWAWLLFRESR